jgi:uncharacterized iron-regulated protein
MRQVALMILLAACGAAPPRISEPRARRIVALPDARDVSMEEMTAALARARVVYVGEAHDREADHEVELAVVRAMSSSERPLAIGLEMIQRPFQSVLDAYVAGSIDEAALLAGVEWEERWGFDFALYRPIFEHARAHRIPIVALNARREITRAVARGGLEALDEDERAELPSELDLTNAAHRAMVERALSEHPGMDAAMLERFYAAQVVWDETMAERVAAFLSEHPEHHMVVLAGHMHVEAGLGIPDRARRRGAEPYAIVLPVAAGDDEELSRAVPRVADYLWVTP